jgi:hypothetical protein
MAMLTALSLLLGSAALGEEAPAPPATPPQQLWRKDVPLQPIRLTMLGRRGAALVGMRNCPDDTQDSALLLDLHNGSSSNRGTSLSGGADAVAARRSPASAPLAAAAAAWNKANATTSVQMLLAPDRLSGAASEAQSFSGDPAMWRSTAIADDGRVAAVLLEPTPDDAHLNNRSSLLRVYSGTCGGSRCQTNASWELRVDGLGATDPQAVAISACSLPSDSATNSGETDQYIVAAIMGTEQLFVSFNAATPASSRVLHRRSSGEVPVRTAAPSFVCRPRASRQAMRTLRCVGNVDFTTGLTGWWASLSCLSEFLRFCVSAF